MKRILFITMSLGLTFSTFSQSNPPASCTTSGLNGDFFPVTPSWQASTPVNTYWGYMTIGNPCSARVGINTTTPRLPLDVNGAIFGKRLALDVDPSSMVGVFHMKYSPSTPPVQGSPAVTLFRIDDHQGIQLMNLNNQGLLRSREIVVDALTWPDYVFEKDYELMSLEETEAYIQENGHLPNVPSEEEVLENGQSLGEMNKILLEKVEELTLHLIEQQKKLNEQQMEIEQLKQQVQK